MTRAAFSRYLPGALALLALAPVAALAQNRAQPVEPLPVVDLKRTEPVLYEKEIEPILFNKCAVCHRDKITEGGFDMGTYEALMKGGRRGKAVIPGNGDKSLLYLAAGRMKKPFMPPKGEEEPLTPEELALIKLWVDQGAKAPTGPSVVNRVVLGVPHANVQPTLDVAIRPDKTAVVGTRGNQIHVYDDKGAHLRALVDPELKGPDGKPVPAAHLSLVESLDFSPDGKVLASGSFQEVLLWEFETGKILKRLGGFADRVVALDFSPDGKLLATGGGAPTQDGEIKLFDVASGTLVMDVKEGHSDTVFGVSFRPDGKVLATCGADKFVKTFEVPSGKFLKSFEGHTHHVMGVGWKGDGKLLASAGADNVVKVWDFEKGEQTRTINAHSKQVTRLAFQDKTSVFATCSGDQRVRMWNADNGGNTRNFPNAASFLYCVDVSLDAALLAAGGEDGLVYLFDGKSNKLIKSAKPPEPGEAPKGDAATKK